MRKFHQELKHLGAYHESNIHGCAYDLVNQKGNYLKKPWKVVLTSQMMASALERRCPGHESHEECLGGTDARNSGFYPQQMCNQISRAVRDLAWEKRGVQMTCPTYPPNNALSRMLAHRGAHPEVIELAPKHVCPDCQELWVWPI